MWLAWVALATASAPAVQQPTTRIASYDPARTQLATSIVDLMDSQDLAFPANLAAWRKLERAVMIRQPLVPRLEENCPRIIDAGIDAAQPIATQHLRTTTAAVSARKAQILASGLSLTDLKAIYAFFSSETGRRFVRGSYAPPGSALVDTVAERAQQSGVAVAGKDEVAMIEKAAAANGIRQLDENGRRALKDFADSAAGKKFKSLQPQLDAVYLQLGHPDADVLKREQDAIQSAMMDYIHHGCGKAR